MEANLFSQMGVVLLEYMKGGYCTLVLRKIRHDSTSPLLRGSAKAIAKPTIRLAVRLYRESRSVVNSRLDISILKQTLLTLLFFLLDLNIKMIIGKPGCHPAPGCPF